MHALCLFLTLVLTTPTDMAQEEDSTEGSLKTDETLGKSKALTKNDTRKESESPVTESVPSQDEMKNKPLQPKLEIEKGHSKTEDGKDDRVSSKTEGNASLSKEDGNEPAKPKTEDKKDSDNGTAKGLAEGAQSGIGVNATKDDHNSTVDSNDREKKGKIVVHFPEKYRQHLAKYRPRNSQTAVGKIIPKHCTQTKVAKGSIAIRDDKDRLLGPHYARAR